VRVAIELFRQRWWALGYALAVVAWICHVVALKFAPLSLVQVTLATSFVFLGVAAERFFGHRVGRRQWAGIAVATVGLALLGGTATQAKPHGSESAYAPAGAVAVEAGLAAAAVALIVSRRGRSVPERRGLVLAAAAGLTFTVTHIGVKALSTSLSATRPASFATPWVGVVVAGFLVAFFASARSLQLGNAVSVGALTLATSSVSAIFAGIVVFGDPVGENAAIIALRMLGFVLVVVAASLMPAPVRAARAQRAEPATAGPGRESPSADGARPATSETRPPRERAPRRRPARSPVGPRS
jgi:drug/metabolite transporter (DMT)-like permease